MQNWERIRQDWETSKITLTALSEKYKVKLGTLKSRKSREGWSRDPTKKDATKNKKVATPKMKVANESKEQIEPIVEGDDLTDKQRLFCIYYVKSFNQTMAAIKAGYSPDRAHVTGSELVRNSKVSKEIRRLKKQMQQEVFIDAMDILNKYIQIAFADITDYVSFGKKEIEVEYVDGEPIMKEVNCVDFNESSQVDGTIIAEVKQGREGISVKLADKMKALDMLTKYFDLLSENDRKKLQEEKLKIETKKLKQETDQSKETQEEQVAAALDRINVWLQEDEDNDGVD